MINILHVLLLLMADLDKPGNEKSNVNIISEESYERLMIELIEKEKKGVIPGGGGAPGGNYWVYRGPR